MAARPSFSLSTRVGQVGCERGRSGVGHRCGAGTLIGRLAPLAGMALVLLILGCGGSSSRPEDVAREFYQGLERLDVAGTLELVCSANRSPLSIQEDFRVLTGLGGLTGGSADELTLEDFSLRITRSDETTAVVQIGGRLKGAPGSLASELPGEVYMGRVFGSWCITSDGSIAAELSSASAAVGACTDLSSPLPEADVPILSVETAGETIRAGETFLAEVVVERVEHLAGFSFGLRYCTDSIEFVDARGGPFLTSGSRRDRICSDPNINQLPGNNARLMFECRTLGPPVSSGGETGAEGSGVVAVLQFMALEPGTTALLLVSSTLVADDLNVFSVQPNDRSVAEIAHARRGLNIDIR